MGGSFACPECGNALALKGTTAGRRVRCGWCETWVEVPFLPRAIAPRARFSKARRPAWVVWAWGGIAVVAVLILTLGASRLLRTRSRQRAEQHLTALVAEASTREGEGRFDEALVAIKDALKAVGRLDPPQPARQAELERLRERVVRRSAEMQIQGAATAPPAEAIATYKALLSRAWREGALEGLEGTLRERLERTRREWAEADLVAARRAIAAGQPNEAVDLCERLIKTADELTPATKSRIQGEASSIATTIIGQRGVVFDPPQGQFTLGSPQSYEGMVRKLLEPALRERGYVAIRPTSSWHATWKARSPYHVSVEVVERQQGSYLNTGSRPSIVSARILLTRGETLVWQAGPLVAQTQPSIPSLSAFLSSRLATDESRRLEFERLLYDDAQASLVGKLGISLRMLPAFHATGS